MRYISDSSFQKIALLKYKKLAELSQELLQYVWDAVLNDDVNYVDRLIEQGADVTDFYELAMENGAEKVLTYLDSMIRVAQGQKDPSVRMERKFPDPDEVIDSVIPGDYIPDDGSWVELSALTEGALLRELAGMLVRGEIEDSDVISAGSRPASGGDSYEYMAKLRDNGNLKVARGRKSQYRDWMKEHEENQEKRDEEFGRVQVENEERITYADHLDEDREEQWNTQREFFGPGESHD
ncbi:MAG: hypothetical protein DRP01_02150 [Archaeoglobales archaeon]|nr:MAG: hypothetical protein DRP01_02150 [Archaeoglobales archaeon]